MLYRSRQGKQVIKKNLKKWCCCASMGPPARVGHLVQKMGFQPVLCSGVKIQQHLQGVKDDLCLQVLGVYRVPCSCRAWNIGQTVRTILTRSGEHERYARLRYTKKSELAEHCITETEFLWTEHL